MKKALVPILAVIAIAAIVLCFVFNGQKGDLQKTIDSVNEQLKATEAKVTEAELEARGVIHTEFGEDLSWDYLSYVRSHPATWTAPTKILYGGKDNLTSLETISRFAKTHNADLTVMEDGEHWFRTEEQMKFLDDWIRRY